MSTSEGIAQGNVLDPARLRRTSQKSGGTVAPAAPKCFLRIPKSKTSDSHALTGRQVVDVTVEQLPKPKDTAADQPPELVDIEVKTEDLGAIRNNPELAPYLRVVHSTETENDTAIAVAMMNSAAARETGAMLQSLRLRIQTK